MSAKHGSDASTAGLSAERIGRNDAIFRLANERINDSAEAMQVEGLSPFVCECADPACVDIVRISLATYSGIREEARHFLNIPGHEAADQGWGHVIERHQAYVVVEKGGPAGEVAEQLEGSPDPATAIVHLKPPRRRPVNPT